MKPTEQRASKRAGTTLTPARIDASRRTNAHRRSESMKDFMHSVKKFSFISMLLAIPALYAMFLWLNWDDTNARNEWIRQGIGAAIAFVLGRANLSMGEKEDDELSSMG